MAKSVQAYVDAVNARDLDALIATFATDAEIIDVSRRIRGHAAILSGIAGNANPGPVTRPPTELPRQAFTNPLQTRPNRMA